jgi:hypothetical protein
MSSAEMLLSGFREQDKRQYEPLLHLVFVSLQGNEQIETEV